MGKKRQVTSMRKLRELFRLKSLGLSQREIANGCNMGRTTVQEYLHRAEHAGLTAEDILKLEEDEISKRLRLYRGRFYTCKRKEDLDYEYLSRELLKKSVTLRLLWDEYRQNTPDGYSYSNFCNLFSAWQKRRKLTMRQVHTPGEKMFVDYSGDTIEYFDREAKETKRAEVFVAVLGFSNYTYAEASESQELQHWIMAHKRALDYFGGTPRAVVPDNLKGAVKKASFYDPDLNPGYSEFALYYGMAVIPARVRKPKDKAKVEVGVQVVQRWILAVLRNEKFFSISEINARIKTLLEAINSKVMRGYGVSRKALFEQSEKEHLSPLPLASYAFGRWKLARVNLDYHIEVDSHYYSVPCTLVHEQVEVRITESVVEIYYKLKRIAQHLRSSKPHQFTTIKEHMPASHRFVSEWSPSRLISWAETIGNQTAHQAGFILSQKQHPEQGYRAVLGLIRLEKKFGKSRLEAACKRANHFGIGSYQAVKNILENGHDKLPLDKDISNKKTTSHSNIRGGQYYH